METDQKAAKKPHFSVTQMDMAAKCWEQWRRRYEEGEVLAPGFALIRGGSVHSAAEDNLRQKIESGRDMPAKEVVELAEAHFQTRVAGGVALDSDEIGQNLAVVQGAAMDTTVRLARLHALHQAPKIKPVSVEEVVRIALPDLPRDLLVVIDCVQEDESVLDIKTTKKAKDQEEADQSNQLSAYSFARQVKAGRIPPRLSLDVLVDTGSQQFRQELVTTRDDVDTRIFGRKFVTMCQQVEAGIFPPAPPGVWWCSAKYCGYHATCDFVRPGRRRQAD